jgi:purine-binding chemotaxis protein CheW
MTDNENRLIIFTLQGEYYALRLGDVAEVMEPPILYPIPRAPHYFTGIMNFHGNLVSVIDLADLLKGNPRDPQGQLLVLDTRIANLALWVESVESVRPAEVIHEEQGSSEALVEKILIMSEREVKMLSVEKLLEKLEEILTGTGRLGGR